MFNVMWEFLREFLIDRLWLLARGIWRVVRVRTFYAFGRHRPKGLGLSPGDIAYAVVGGRILAAIAFRNLGSDRAFIAAARGDDERGMTYRVVLLEAFGHVYRKTWESPELWGRRCISDHFASHDFDNDGHHELSFASLSLGSGAGSASMYLFVPSASSLYELHIGFDWQDHLSPPVPTISVRPEGKDAATRRFHRALEKLARESGFLDSVKMPDLDDPRNASIRWHKDNRDLKTGSPIIHYYGGLPAFVGSETAVLDENDARWTAYFKGPVVAYLKKEDRHFVVYCPVNIYHWPTCVCRAGKFILIGTRGDGLIRYSPQARWLEQLMLRNHGQALEEIVSIAREEESYVINGTVHMAASSLEA